MPNSIRLTQADWLGPDGKTHTRDRAIRAAEIRTAIERKRAFEQQRKLRVERDSKFTVREKTEQTEGEKRTNVVNDIRAECDALTKELEQRHPGFTQGPMFKNACLSSSQECRFGVQCHNWHLERCDPADQDLIVASARKIAELSQKVPLYHNSYAHCICVAGEVSCNVVKRPKPDQTLSVQATS